MPEALARSHNDFVLSRPARQAQGAATKSRWLAVAAFAAGFSRRAYAGAVLAAVLAGIAVNALTLQRERHPTPFFAAQKPAPAATPQPAEAAAAEAPPALAILPPTRPASLPGGAEPAPAPAPARPIDAIGELLRGDGEKDAQRVTLAAQNDLIKLGFAIKANGVAGPATTQALRDFEKSRGLPISAELTPRLLKLLAAAAGR